MVEDLEEDPFIDFVNIFTDIFEEDVIKERKTKEFNSLKESHMEKLFFGHNIKKYQRLYCE